MLTFDHGWVTGGTVDCPRQTCNGETPKFSIFSEEEVPEKHEISFE